MIRTQRRVPRLIALAAATLLAGAAFAQTRLSIDIPAEPLDAALNALARQAGAQLVFASSLTAGKTAPRVQGQMSVEDALDRLLAQSGLVARKQGSNTFTIEPTGGSAQVTLPATVATASAQQESATGPVRGYIAQRSATGTKTDVPLSEIPQSISVVSRDRFEAQGAQSVNEALRYSASVSSYGAGTRSDWYTAVRGFVPATYLDGLQLPNTINLASWRVDPWQIERVELLRGPSSVLYGQGDPGGTVNVVTKQPTTEPIREIEVQYGSHARKQVAGDFAGALDADGKLSYRLTAVARDGNLPFGPFKDQRLMVAPSLTWKPSADTTLTLLATYLRDKTNSSDNFLPASGTILPNPNGKIPATLFTGSPDFDAYEKTQYSLGYQFEHKLNDTWTVRQNTRYMHLKLDDRMTYGVGLDPSDPTQRMMWRYAGIARPSYGRFDVDTQVQAKFATGIARHTFLAGVDYQRQTTKDPETYALTSSLDLYNPVHAPFDWSIFNGSGASPQDIHQKQTQLGVYLQDQIKLGERWVFTLGGHHDWSDLRTDDLLAGTNTSQRDSAFTGRVGVVYLGPYGLSPYMSYSTSFNPTIGTDRSNQPFKPTKGKQVEAGIKFAPTSKTSITAAVFQIHQTNVLTPDLNDPTGMHSAQSGEIRSQGIELEGTTQLLPGWNVIASYTYQDVRNTKANDVTLNKWPIAIPIPRQMASLWTDYRIRSGVLQGVGIGAGVRYTSPTAGAPDNSLKVPGYTLFDASIFYNVGHWRFALNGTNLGNREVISGCYDATRCIYNNGRTVLATAKYAW
ncbi:TonB-dependent receptor [Ralstonia sp. A12]|uniref:TonB-dependent siderophore receptor n=1 Tax=Ralstonia sp. A12 TaxID=1217052 RepID=UPI0005734F2E|nr:TonB-dependent siderophore receptor [Ralstonia sp. A12]KHK54135.1 TonB-dependent receptor [Ralstonia sp. A12]